MRTKLLKKLLLPLLFMAVCIHANAATGTMTIGNTTVPDLTKNASGIGWTWDAPTATLNLISSYNNRYTGEAIAINCESTDEINLVYTGNISISNSNGVDEDGIYCAGSLTIDGSGGTLSFTYTGENNMYNAIASMGLLTISSGDVYAECAALGSSSSVACAVYASFGFNITGTANVTSNVTSAYSNGLFATNYSEISTTGTVTANATGEGYAIYIANGYNLTISNGTIDLSNADTPENMIFIQDYYKRFTMTGGTVTYNGGTPPTFSSLSPASGTYNTEVVLSGDNLTGTTNVFVNGKESKSFTVSSDSQVTFTTPASEAGFASVLVETSGGARAYTGFTYTATSYRVTILSGGSAMGWFCGFVDTEAGTITKPADPVPITSGAYTYAFTGGWYTNRLCTTEWDFDSKTVDRDMNIYAEFEELPAMTPADNAVDVAIDATVSASYYSVTENDLSGITLSPDPGNVSASLTGNTITIAHDDFEPDTKYTVTIPAGATDRNTIDVVWSFTTEAVPPLSSDATLSSLTVSAGTLTPAFSASVTEYTITVAHSVSSITIATTANDGNATITGDTGTQLLSVGTNAYNIVVTAEDGTTTKTYKVRVTRQSPPLSSDATLSSLTVSEGTLTPAFSASIIDYTVNVEYDIEGITIHATANDGNASVSGTGVKSLDEGANPFDIVVTAEDGTWKTYTVVVTRATNPVGIEGIYTDNGIQIYPNPITDYFSVKGITGQAMLSVYTAYGKIVLQRKVQAEENIPASNLPSGIYLIHVEGTTFKVVKR